MANIYKGTLGLIGNTPLVEVINLEKNEHLKATVMVKLEYFNPAGSVKDRIAKAMVEDAEEKGLLKPGSVIIEPTSDCRCQGLSADYYDAGNHERRTQKYSEVLWCRTGSDRRFQGHEGSHRQSGEAGERDP